MKRNCNGCRAFANIRGGVCELNYRLDSNRQYKGITLEWKPLEECPKPKTYDQLFDAQMKRRGLE